MEQIRPPIVTILGHVDHGKCVAGDTLIPLTDGRILKASEIFEIYSKDLEPELLPEGEKFELNKSIKIFSFNGKNIVTRNIYYLWKLKSPDKLIKVTLYSGDVVELTPEHPFYIFTSEGEIVQKRADELKINEFVIVPKNLTFKFTTLEVIKEEILQRLLTGGSWVVSLDGRESGQFWRQIKKYKISTLIQAKLFSSDARTQITKKRLRVSDYIALGFYLGFTKLQLYDFISSIKNSSPKWRAGHTSNKITLPKTREDFSKIGYILGCIVGDGSFDSNNVYLHNNDREVYSTYRAYLEEVFDVTTSTKKGHTALITKNDGGRTLKRFLAEIFGIPLKNKSALVEIPELVRKNDLILREFVAGLFDTDGYVSHINYMAEFTSKSQILLKQLGIILLYFGIHSTLYQKKGFTYLRIANKPYLEIFLQEFNFKLTYKRDRMKGVLSKSSVSRIFDYTPLRSKLLSDIQTNSSMIPYWDNYKKTPGLLTRPFLKNLINLGLFTYKNQMQVVLNTDVSSVRVRTVEIVEPTDKFVYDFTVSDTHNFVAERIIVHNTTLLDFIRKSSVAAKEHGGITQHIGAYQISVQAPGNRQQKNKTLLSPDASNLITFIDTPGHAAFEKMRSRGAKVADIVVLVVAADDGVMPQTVEAIKHILESHVPMIVVVNKIDLPGIDLKVQLNKIKKQLSDQKINLEEYGGDVPVVPLSAKTGEGVDKLLEMILLVAEMHELKGNPANSPAGVVIEANLDKFKGPVATVLIQNGTLKKGMQIVLGGVKSKIRGMFDHNGKIMEAAGPSTPVEVLGLESVPAVGAVLGELPEVKEAEATVSLVDKLKTRDTKTLKVIIKADKQGSLEAIQGSLDKFNEEKKIVDFVFTGTGDIGEENVKLARAVGAIVIGFNVKVAPTAQKMAEQEHVLIRTYSIIYELLEDVEEVVSTLLEVGQLEEVLGKANIIAEFPHGKVERIAGCRVIEGGIAKGQRIRIVREEKVIGETKIKSLKKVKEEVNKVEKGSDCGMLFDPPIDFQIGDRVESFRVI